MTADLEHTTTLIFAPALRETRSFALTLFLAYMVKGYQPLHAPFEMEQQELAPGLNGRTAITKMPVQFICLTLQPSHRNGRESGSTASVNNSG